MQHAFKRIASSSRTRANFPTPPALHFTYERGAVNFEYVKLERSVHIQGPEWSCPDYSVLYNGAMGDAIFNVDVLSMKGDLFSIDLANSQATRHGRTIAWRTHCSSESTVLALSFSVLNLRSGIIVLPSLSLLRDPLFVHPILIPFGGWPFSSTKLYSNIADLNS